MQEGLITGFQKVFEALKSQPEKLNTEAASILQKQATSIEGDRASLIRLAVRAAIYGDTKEHFDDEVLSVLETRLCHWIYTSIESGVPSGFRGWSSNLMDRDEVVSIIKQVKDELQTDTDVVGLFPSSVLELVRFWMDLLIHLTELGGQRELGHKAFDALNQPHKGWKSLYQYLCFVANSVGKFHFIYSEFGSIICDWLDRSLINCLPAPIDFSSGIYGKVKNVKFLETMRYAVKIESSRLHLSSEVTDFICYWISLKILLLDIAEKFGEPVKSIG